MTTEQKACNRLAEISHIRNHIKSRLLIRKLNSDWQALAVLMEEISFSKTQARNILRQMEWLGLLETKKDKYKQRPKARLLYKLTDKGLLFKARCFE